ncbi:MAG: peptidoglycan DD-metalloendopeptidase family protein [Synergistaceae bacterium]|nr:peptidoglycan DD-metalloendopeptidase family protein [Synergistaceae bacterium]
MLKTIKLTFKNKKIIYSAVFFLISLILVALILASVAAEKNGMYWAGLDSLTTSDNQINSKGLIMVDVSDLIYVSGLRENKTETENETIPLTIGPVPCVSPLTPEEVKLYGILSKANGLLTNETAFELDEDIYWQEVVLKKNDTIESLAKEFGISVDNIRQANNMKKNQSPSYSEVIYIPDSSKYVDSTLAFVKKMERAAEEETKKAKTLSIIHYLVKEGDSLWTIANKFDLKVDTIVGSNKLSDINILKIGSQLRIPNQDGVFVKIDKNINMAEFADKYGSTRDAVYFANKLNEKSKISIGQEIFLPGGAIASNKDEQQKVKKRPGISRMAKTRATTTAQRIGWPVFGRISSSFGWRRSPFGKRRRFHTGIDIRAPRGRNIVAASNGRVVHSGWMGGYGKTIVIAHPSGISTLYGHCSSLVVCNGTTVRKGQLIARVGSTGRSTGNHLHFEVRRGGSPVNPMSYLR